MNIIEERINLLWEGVVYDFNFNAPMHRIDFRVQTNYNSVIKNYNVTISEISFFLFYDKSAERSGNYDWEATEISTIFYEPNAVISHKTLADRYNEGKPFNIDYNISLELWSSDLLIKAKKFQINEEVFELE